MAKQTILVVDDDADFLEQMRVQLEAAGYAVVTAAGQAKAEEALARGLPDLLLVDLMMEQADGGFSLCYHAKRRNPDLPVIIVTAVTSETGLEFDAATDEERSWIKADAILPKPVRFEQLAREMARLLKGRDGGNAATARD